METRNQILGRYFLQGYGIKAAKKKKRPHIFIHWVSHVLPPPESRQCPLVKSMEWWDPESTGLNVCSFIVSWYNLQWVAHHFFAIVRSYLKHFNFTGLFPSLKATNFTKNIETHLLSGHAQRSVVTTCCFFVFCKEILKHFGGFSKILINLRLTDTHSDVYPQGLS